MRCGRERTAAAPDAAGAEGQAPPAPPSAPPPPAFAPAPASAPAPAPVAPSPVGAFFGRAVRGDWAGAAQAALWPVGLLLVAAFALGIPSYGQDSGDVVIGFTARVRLALATLLQGVGGSLEATARTGVQPGAQDDSGLGVGGSLSVSVVPLLVTVLWIVALVLGTRMLRTRLYARLQPGMPGQGATAGLEAAVRVAALVTGATFVLSLVAQPGFDDISVSTGPFLTALWTLLLSLAVTGGVLHQDDLRYRVAAARPGVRTAVRAFGTAVRAMGLVLVVAAVLGAVGIALFGESGASTPTDAVSGTELDGSDLAAYGVFLMLLPNLAVTALGLCWGAPVNVEAKGASSWDGGSSYEHESMGLSRIADEAGSGALWYMLAVGLICALTVAFVAARRAADRREQLLSVGLFFGLFLLLAGISGLGGKFGGDAGPLGSGNGTMTIGLSFQDALLFGLLWCAGAAVAGPYLLKWTGLTPTPAFPYGAAPVDSYGAAPVDPYAAYAPPGYAPAPPAPGTAGTPVTPSPADPAAGVLPPADAPTQDAPPAEPVASPSVAPGGPAYGYGYPAPGAADPGAYQLAPVPAPDGAGADRRGLWTWVAVLVGALVVGGGVAAGVVLLQGGDDGGKDAKNAPSVSASASAQADASDTPTPTASVSAEASPESDPAAEPSVPAGYHRVTDPQGFSFAVPEAWTRESVKNGSQITYAGPTGVAHYLVGVIPAAGYTSYDNTLQMERHAKADPEKGGYQRIRLEKNTFQGRPGAIWEYTYADPSGRTLHCVDQSYIAEDGTEYAVLLTAQDEDWATSERMYQVALDSWRLTGQG
jgi:hypothetical protein